MELSDLGLCRFPFATVPDPDRARIWAGRSDLKKKLSAKVSDWGRKTGSEIDLFWADWGQGKSHSLFYLQNLLADDASNVVHYLQLPSLATVAQPFKAIYDQLMADFPLDDLATRVYDFFEPANNMNQLFSPAVRRAWPVHVLHLLWMIKVRNQNSFVAENYLRGHRVTQRELSQLQIGGQTVHLPPPPRTAQDCQKLLSDVIKVATTFPKSGGQCVLLIDEFQRVSSLTKAKKQQVCDSLHLIFNSNPRGLRMVLTFAIGDPRAIPFSLTGDLISRVTDRLSLPAMDEAEVHLHLSELLPAHQSESDEILPSAPFDEKGLKTLSAYAYEASDGDHDLCTPRKVNMVGEAILLHLMNITDHGAGGSSIHFFNGDDVDQAIRMLDGDIRARISGDFDDGEG